MVQNNLNKTKNALNMLIFKKTHNNFTDIAMSFI